MGNAKSPGMFPTPIEEKIVESCDLEIAIPEIRILIELISINRINHKKKNKKVGKGRRGRNWIPAMDRVWEPPPPPPKKR